MKNLIHHFRTLGSRFQTRLLAAVLFCTLVPLSVISIVSCLVSYKIARDKIMDSATLAADQIQLQLNDRIRQTENVADTLQYNMYTMSLGSSENFPRYLEDLSQLRNNLSMYKSSFGFYHIAVFFDSSQMASLEGLYFYPMEKLPAFGVSLSQLSDLGASSRWFFCPEISLPLLLNGSKKQADCLICSRALFAQTENKNRYAYLILLDMDDFSAPLTAFQSSDITVSLVTPNGLIAASSVSAKKGMSLTQDQMAAISQNAGRLLSQEQDFCYILPLDNGWFQITEIPKGHIRQSIFLLLRSVLLTLLLTLPFTILLVLLISNSLSRRIRCLAHTMEHFRLSAAPGLSQVLQIPRPANPDYYDEIDQLGVTLEEMEHTIQKNVTSIVDLSVTEERLKYQLLQSQINPHFLYNILGSIKACQTTGHLDLAGQMIDELTSFYRLTLRRSQDLIRIRDELEIVSLYLNIEKKCRSDTLEWSIETEDGVEQFMICRFTLQPFVENSILHGISSKTPNLQIDISVVYGDDTVVITIQDNGAGIPPQKLAELQESLRTHTVSYEKHFGICNVNARIGSELYGSGHISIESTPLKGTRVTIEFAQIEGEEEE